MESSPLFLWSCILISSCILTTVLAESGYVYYDWTVELSIRSPLGVPKQVIVINDQFPGPLVNATTNDVVAVNVRNHLPEPLLITWNGVQMRRNSWQDGVQGTNCPIQPGQNWTYSFQLKDQIGSFFYFPSLLLQKAGGGYGAVRVNNRKGIPIPFPQPAEDFDLLVGDWYNAHHRDLRAMLDQGRHLPRPDGVLINGHGRNHYTLHFQPGLTYRLRISNVGIRTSLNFRIQDHPLVLVETEGSYTVKKRYSSLDVHVGQSYSVLVKAKNLTHGHSFYIFVSSRFTKYELLGLGVVRYHDSIMAPSGPILPSRPAPLDYAYSINQARSIKWDLDVGAARRNPQGSYHYGAINISRTLVLENDLVVTGSSNRIRYTVNGVSFVHPDTPLKLADRFEMFDELKNVVPVPSFPDAPQTAEMMRLQRLGTSVVDVKWRDFYHLVFQNPLTNVQTWHLDGYNFFVVGMGPGQWNENAKLTYNMVDAVSRSTVQVYPQAWTAVLVMLDNRGMWNLRSQNGEKWYLGQELYLRVKGSGAENPLSIPARDEAPIPGNAILCGRVMNRTSYF